MRVTSFSMPLAIVITFGLRFPDCSDCGLVHGLSCCVPDARFKCVHPATRLVVIFRGQLCLPRAPKNVENLKRKDKQDHAQTGRMWTSADGMLFLCTLAGCTLKRNMTNTHTCLPSPTLARWVLTNRVFDPQDDRRHLPQSSFSRWRTLDSKTEPISYTLPR